MPGVLLVLTGPSGPSVPHDPGTGKISGAGWNDPGQDRSGLWLRNAAAGLCVLAAAAAVVSFTAQYRMVDATRHLPVVAALEAAIPDAAALVFACLGIALALHRRTGTARPGAEPGLCRRQRIHERHRGGPRLAEPGHLGDAAGRHALASDTLIGVVRARALARHLQLGTALATDAATPLAYSAAWPCGYCAWPWPPPPP